MTDIEKVQAACPKSRYKDDSHEWKPVMDRDDYFGRNGGVLCVKKCEQCNLHVLAYDSASYGPIGRHAIIIHAFFWPKERE